MVPPQNQMTKFPAQEVLLETVGLVEHLGVNKFKKELMLHIHIHVYTCMPTYNGYSHKHIRVI